jgi:hypothetical protein
MLKARLHKKQALIIFSILALILGSATILACRSLDAYRSFFGMYHDDGIYLVTAKSLAENLGYRIISLPGSPFETKYPIGFPFLLSLAWRLFPNFPQNLNVLLPLQVVTSFAAVVVAVCYLVKTGKVTIALAAVILPACLFNYHFLDFAPMIMSDMPFALFSFLALWATERFSASKNKSPSAPIALGLLLASCATLRLQGIVVILSSIVFLVIRRKLAAAATILGIATVSLAPQLIWQAEARAEIAPYLSFYTNYVAHAYSTLPDLRLLVREAQSCFYWSVLMQVNTYLPFLQNIEYESLSPKQLELIYRVIYPLLILPLLIGLVVGVRRGSLPAIYLLLHAISLTVWPVRLEWRHIFTVLPLSYFLFFLGSRAIAKRLKRAARARRSLFQNLCAALSLGFSAYLIAGATGESLQYVGEYQHLVVSPTVVINLSVMAHDSSQTFSWIRSNTPEQAVFISNNDPSFFLYTSRKALLPSPLEIWRFVKMRLVDAQSLLSAIQFGKADYVLAEPTFRGSGMSMDQTDQAVESLRKRFPGAVKTVFKSSNGLMRIYEIKRELLPK